MTVDQVITAAKHWRLHRDSQTIAAAMNLPESVIYSNLWRIRAVAAPHRRTA